MVTFKNNNNNRKNNFRRSERNFKNNSSDKNRFQSNYNVNENIFRKNASRNNLNAPKLFEKYSNLAREALSTGDKILSENYFQHADHFKRIINENENFKKSKQLSSKETTDKNNNQEGSQESDEGSIQGKQVNLIQ